MASVNTVKVLDHGYVRLVEAWGHGDAGVREDNAFLDDYECGIIEAARQSTQASFRGWDEDKKLLAFLHNNKHSTPFEFAGMVIEVQAPIFVFREWHRHRTQSYNEMSARYAPLPDLNYVPTVDRLFLTSQKNKQAGTVKGADELLAENALNWLDRQKALYQQFEEHYQEGLRMGVPKEVARIGMPVGRYSRMRASANLRNWLEFVTLRSDPAAQWEIRQFSDVVGKIISEQFPRTWELFSRSKS